MTESVESRGFVISVMGEGVKFPIQPDEKLRVPSEKALVETHQTEKDLSKWVLTNPKNVELSFDETEGHARLRPGEVLSLTPKKSAGG
jgi:hypothetical protein